MRLTVHAVAGKLPRWVAEGSADYERRLPRELKLVWRDVPLARRGADGRAAILAEREGERMLKGVGHGDRVIALDPAGEPWQTVDLARHLADWQMDGRPVAFLVGGPDGLSPACRERAERSWSLGRLTLPHPLVRIVLVEQLYRAWTILTNHPYHRG
ncbi:23S rRNA (pseudouridine(1915)-N(3))-methyltransferase RlmH [Pseudohaliea rubra]|uniref:Ribosomal RNA large subunit methyltransferase H n=1 Tax=Pseudohaliea rubra DSM 19751 TaxID=1265313 RepID=A0A095VN84_9GAMM|nr:23S rRNA (pseudouridine(1915)-N(3))-methyltransferase RlmH [Pseudohaliea rubra]KGE02558.1 LSU m3methyltransferase RlmH [Pseudohaliea rubra DSM 19751]